MAKIKSARRHQIVMADDQAVQRIDFSQRAAWNTAGENGELHIPEHDSRGAQTARADHGAPNPRKGPSFHILHQDIAERGHARKYPPLPSRKAHQHRDEACRPQIDVADLHILENPPVEHLQRYSGICERRFGETEPFHEILLVERIHRIHRLCGGFASYAVYVYVADRAERFGTDFDVGAVGCDSAVAHFDVFRGISGTSRLDANPVILGFYVAILDQCVFAFQIEPVAALVERASDLHAPGGHTIASLEIARPPPAVPQRDVFHPDIAAIPEPEKPWLLKHVQGSGSEIPSSSVYRTFAGDGDIVRTVGKDERMTFGGGIASGDALSRQQYGSLLEMQFDPRPQPQGGGLVDSRRNPQHPSARRRKGVDLFLDRTDGSQAHARDHRKKNWRHHPISPQDRPNRNAARRRAQPSNKATSHAS